MADDEPGPLKRSPITHGRADIAQMVRGMMGRAKDERARDIREREHVQRRVEYDRPADEFWAVLEGTTSGVRLRVISGLPFWLDDLEASGPTKQSAERRLRGAYLNAIVDKRIASNAEARAWARRMECRVASSILPAS